MCGIVGSVSTKPIANARWITDGRELLKHRGPDAFGEWISNDRKAIFQHQRLAIIDLSKKSNQPMVSEDKSSPARSLLVLSFTISAFFLSLLFVIVDDKFKLMKNRKNI